MPSMTNATPALPGLCGIACECEIVTHLAIRVPPVYLVERLTTHYSMPDPLSFCVLVPVRPVSSTSSCGVCPDVISANRSQSALTTT